MRSSGFYLRSVKADCKTATSEGLYVYSNSSSVAEGDIVTLGGKVTEYR
ncbi:hypothetical protein IMZ48_05525 [Candidatus Bathyarchaeota archaeon]|nr:hypothetical protein [Candidatus Bathyarchaeota archaeon]